MKNIILKWLGFDKITIESMKQEVAELKTTINSLSNDLNNLYGKTQKAFTIIKSMKIDLKNELWWENRDTFSMIGRGCDIETFRIANQIRNDAKIAWVERYPTLKERKIFHGGCLGCQTPINKGIGTCLGCKYLSSDYSKPDLKTN